MPGIKTIVQFIRSIRIAAPPAHRIDSSPPRRIDSPELLRYIAP